MAEEKPNKMSGSREGPDFDDPHHDHVAAKPEESPAVSPVPPVMAKEEKSAKGKADADNSTDKPA